MFNEKFEFALSRIKKEQIKEMRDNLIRRQIRRQMLGKYIREMLGK
jgi:hypothetical protein